MMIMKFMRKSKGFISIFLCLVLLPMVTFSTMVIDVSRIQNARVLVTSAGDLAMNAGMSEYNKTLQEMYGIFATNTSSEDLEKALANYFAKTIEGSIGTNNLTEKDYIQKFSDKFTQELFNSEDIQNGDFTNFMQMVLDAQTEASKSFEYSCVDNSSPANPAVMKQQIVDYMKYKGPISLSMNLLDKIGAMKDAKKQSEAVEKKLDYTKTLDDITDPCEKAFKAVYGEDTDFSSEEMGYNDYVKTYNDNYLADSKAFNKGLTSDSTAYKNIVENMEKMTEFALYYTIALIASGQLPQPEGSAGYNMSDAGLKGLKYGDFEKVIQANKNNEYNGWASGSQSTIDGCCELFDKWIAGKDKYRFSDYPKRIDISEEKINVDFNSTNFDKYFGDIKVSVKITPDTKYELGWKKDNNTTTKYIKDTKVESVKCHPGTTEPNMSKELIEGWKAQIKEPTEGASYEDVCNADGKTFDLILNTLDKEKKYEDILKFIYYYEQITVLKDSFDKSWKEYDKTEIKQRIENKKAELKLDKERYDYENSSAAHLQLQNIENLKAELKEYDEVTIPALTDDLNNKVNDFNKKKGIYQNYSVLLSDIDADNKNENDENKKKSNIYTRINDITENKDYDESFRNELSDIVNNSSYNTADKIYQALNDKMTDWDTAKKSAETEKNKAQTKLNIEQGTRDKLNNSIISETNSYNTRKTTSKKALEKDAELIVKTEPDEKGSNYYDKKLKKEVVEKLASEFDGIDSELKGFLVDLSEHVKQFKEHGKPYLKAAMEQIDDFYVCVCECYKFAESSEQALNEVLQHYDKVEAALKDWQNSANAVEDNTTKATMLSDANSTSTGLKKDDIDHAVKAAQNRKEYYKNLKEMLESIRFFDDGKLIDSSKTDSFKVTESHVDNVYNKILEHKDKNGLGYVAKDKRKADKIRATVDGSKSKELVVGHLLDSRPNSKNPTAFNWNPNSTSLAKENDYEIKFGDMMDGYKTVSLSGTSEGESYDYEIFFKVLINIVKPKENTDETAKKNAEKIKQVKTDAVVNDKGEMPNTSSSGGSSGKVEKQTTTAQTVTVNDEVLVNAQKSINEYGANGGRCEDNTNDAGDKRKDFELSDKKKDYSKNSDQAKESMKQAGNLLDNLSRIGKNVLQDAYLEEYFTEMFTCQTDILYKNVEKKNAKMLNGVTIKEMYATNTAWYGGEIEYIIWGGNDVVSAKIKNEVAIYALRLVFNLIYACTAADIQEFTLTAATAIAGWTVVGVPLVQFLLTVGLAVAESSLDVIKLKNGEDVAIYKNMSTFVCSPSGALQEAATTVAKYAISEAAERAQDKINKTVESLADKGYEKIGDITDAEKEKLKTDFVNAQAENIKTTVKNLIATPLIDKLKPVFILKDTAKDTFNTEVKTKINEAFEGIETSIASIENDVVKSIAEQAASNFKGKLETKLQDVNSEIFGYDADEFATYINKEIDDTIKDLNDIINGKLDQIGNNFKKQLEQYKDKSVNKLKELTAKSTTSAAEKLTSNATKLIDDKLGDIDVKKVDSSSSGGVTLNYKEYCKIFVLIGLMSEDNQVSMLKRCAALCQANVQHPGDKFKADDSFEMVKVNTVVTVHAKVKLGTLFPWGVTVSENGTHNDTSVNISQLGGHSVIIDYQGVNAY